MFEAHSQNGSVNFSAAPPYQDPLKMAYDSLKVAVPETFHTLQKLGLKETLSNVWIGFQETDSNIPNTIRTFKTYGWDAFGNFSRGADMQDLLTREAVPASALPGAYGKGTMCILEAGAITAGLHEGKKSRIRVIGEGLLDAAALFGGPKQGAGKLAKVGDFGARVGGVYVIDKYFDKLPDRFCDDNELMIATAEDCLRNGENYDDLNPLEKESRLRAFYKQTVAQGTEVKTLAFQAVKLPVTEKTEQTWKTLSEDEAVKTILHVIPSHTMIFEDKIEADAFAVIRAKPTAKIKADALAVIKGKYKISKDQKLTEEQTHEVGQLISTAMAQLPKNQNLTDEQIHEVRELSEKVQAQLESEGFKVVGHTAKTGNVTPSMVNNIMYKGTDSKGMGR